MLTLINNTFLTALQAFSMYSVNNIKIKYLEGSLNYVSKI